MMQPTINKRKLQKHITSEILFSILIHLTKRNIMMCFSIISLHNTYIHLVIHAI